MLGVTPAGDELGEAPAARGEDWGQRDPSVTAWTWQGSVGSWGGDCSARGRYLWLSTGWS